MRRYKHLDHSAKRRIGASPRVQWLQCQAGAVDANHLRTEANQQANSLAADMGQITVFTRPPLRTSILIEHCVHDNLMWTQCCKLGGNQLGDFAGGLPCQGNRSANTVFDSDTN